MFVEGMTDNQLGHVFQGENGRACPCWEADGARRPEDIGPLSHVLYQPFRGSEVWYWEPGHHVWVQMWSVRGTSVNLVKTFL